MLLQAWEFFLALGYENVPLQASISSRSWRWESVINFLRVLYSLMIAQIGPFVKRFRTLTVGKCVRGRKLVGNGLRVYRLDVRIEIVSIFPILKIEV